MDRLSGSGHRGKDAPMLTSHSINRIRGGVYLLIAALFAGGVFGSAARAGWLVKPPDPRILNRSEERRAGEECRSRGAPYH